MSSSHGQGSAATEVADDTEILLVLEEELGTFQLPISNSASLPFPQLSHLLSGSALPSSSPSI